MSVKADLNITIQGAGDPERLSAVLNAAMEYAAKSQPARVEKVVPDGYRCIECYHEDGGHSEACDIGAQMALRHQRQGVQG